MPGIAPLVVASWKSLEAPRGLEGPRRGQRLVLWLLAGQQGCESEFGQLDRTCVCCWTSQHPLPEASSQGLPGPAQPLSSCPQLFHEAAYQADDRQDLLSAISEFLDGSIVIPPSEVEGRDLLRSVAAFQRELLRKRREREQTKVETTTRGSCVAPGKG